MKTIFIGLLITVLSNFAMAGYIAGPKPEVEGRFSDVGNCGDAGTDGWAQCWGWNHLNKNWELTTVSCPEVRCHKKFPPAQEK